MELYAHFPFSTYVGLVHAFMISLSSYVHHLSSSMYCLFTFSSRSILVSGGGGGQGKGLIKTFKAIASWAEYSTNSHSLHIV